MTHSLGEVLRKARLRAGVTQRALARRSDVGQAAISRIESGRESPSFERFAHLLACLGLQPSVRLEPFPFRGDPRQLVAAAELTPAQRLEGAFNWSEFGDELRAAAERHRR